MKKKLFFAPKVCKFAINSLHLHTEEQISITKKYMDEERIINTLKLYDKIYKSVIEEYLKLLVFVEKFIKLMRKEERSLPYHMNVIDELHIDENGHSRILLKLLQFKNEKGEYELLDSLLKYIKERNHICQFSNIQIQQPEITQEKARIDLWVRDKKTGYSIIFENKVYNARDQEAQISRYIDRTIEEKFDVSNIFVVYLSSMGKEPDEQSWGGYKEDFRDRYINLSFRDDIITWLKKSVLPNICHKEVYLYTAIMQYKDYLEGNFRLRTINKHMNKKLKDFITNHFELDEYNDSIAKIEELNKRMKDVNEVIEIYKNELRLCVFDEWKQKVQELYPDLVCETKEKKLSVSFSLEGKPFVITINEPIGKIGIHCQVNFEDWSDLSNTKLKEKLCDILPKEYNKDTIYNDYGNEEFKQVFDLFCEVVERCERFASPLSGKC